MNSTHPSIPFNTADDLMASKEALEQLLVWRGADSPLWTAVEAALGAIRKTMAEGIDQ